ncbi:polyketide cyclase, partial [Klebsiella michiganensis]
MLKKTIVAFALFCALTPAVFAGNSENEQLNKKNVIDFYNKALNDKDFAAARPYLGDRYIQHNPMAKD